MQSRFYKWGWKVLDVLFPPTCAGCGELGERYCPTCLEDTELIPGPICQICGDLLRQSQNVVCARCQSQQIAYSAVRSWAVFEEPLQSAIHKLKYQQDRGLGEALAQPLVKVLDKYLWPIDLIVPVPLDSVRKKERGYNQAVLLARPLAWETGIELSTSALSRVKLTRQQVGLNLSERQENMMGAFEADVNQVKDKRILLIDDVITTGATLNACGFALLKAGAHQVFGLTLARSAHI